jgi:hypothetical protein
MKKHALALLALSFAFLSGCSQTSFPQQCQNVAPSLLPNCVYVNAVMDQNPFYCYSLEDHYQRQTCLKDAADPAMRSALQRALPSERDSIFAPQQPEQPARAPQATPEQQHEVTPAPSAPSPMDICNTLSGTDRDECLRSLALDSNNVTICGAVNASSVRENCIAQVARATKDPSACGSLNQTNADLCNLYSKGE